MKIPDRPPYHDRPTALSFGFRTVDVRGHQIIVWLSRHRPVFPAMPDENPGAPRLPLLGRRPISRGRLKLIIDGDHREVMLCTPGWF